MSGAHAGSGIPVVGPETPRISCTRPAAYTEACALGDHRSDFGAYKPLEADGYRVLSFDFRGHGQSSATKPYTFEQIVDDVEGLRSHFAGASRVIVCGGSFG